MPCHICLSPKESGKATLLLVCSGIHVVLAATPRDIWDGMPRRMILPRPHRPWSYLPESKSSTRELVDNDSTKSVHRKQVAVPLLARVAMRTRSYLWEPTFQRHPLLSVGLLLRSKPVYVPNSRGANIRVVSVAYSSGQQLLYSYCFRALVSEWDEP